MTKKKTNREIAREIILNWQPPTKPQDPQSQPEQNPPEQQPDSLPKSS